MIGWHGASECAGLTTWAWPSSYSGDDTLMLVVKEKHNDKDHARITMEMGWSHAWKMHDLWQCQNCHQWYINALTKKKTWITMIKTMANMMEMTLTSVHQDWHNYDVLDFSILCWPYLLANPRWNCPHDFTDDSQKTENWADRPGWPGCKSRKPINRQTRKQQPGWMSKVRGAWQEKGLERTWIQSFSL